MFRNFFKEGFKGHPKILLVGLVARVTTRALEVVPPKAPLNIPNMARIFP